MDTTKLTRRKAFLIHLSISVGIFIVLTAIIVFWWFPGALFTLDGGWLGVKIAAGVDLVLGPTLTLLLFRPKKKQWKELRFDLSAIAVVQIAALVWGIGAIHGQHTAVLNFAEGQFHSVSYKDLKEADKALVKAEVPVADLTSISNQHPPVVYTKPLGKDFGQYLASVFNGLPEIPKRSDRFAPLTDHLEGLRKHALDVAQATKDNADLADRLSRAVKKHGLGPEDVAYYRLSGRYGKGIAILDMKEVKLVDIVPGEIS